MKSLLVWGAIALPLALGGTALAADAPAAPAAPPPPPDPVAAFFNPLFSPIGAVLDPLGPIADTVNKPIAAFLPQPAPDAPAAAPPAPKKHRRHRKHHMA